MTEPSSSARRPPLILTQIATRLHEIFDGHIDLSDVAGRPADQQESYFLTRAYLALYFLDEVGLSAADAASCITDGGADDGIDGVYIDKKNAKIYFGQSKWRSNIGKGIELTDFVRFRDGVQSVVQLNWTADNKNLHRFRDDIEEQLSSIDTEVVMILAHTSEQPIAENINSKIKEFLAKSNEYNPNFLSFAEFKLVEAARVARSAARPENITFTVLLTQWGLLSTPHRAVYGSVAATDVVSWFEEYGNKIFAENLRYGIEKSDVNDGIQNTAHNDPENFWYYNNGITSICESVEKQPIGGPDTSSGLFDVKKISVINGAQTISSLSKAKQAGADLSRIRVHLRIISLQNTPENFSSNVTSANNTQNNLNPVDFVAVDPNQDRIRRECQQLGLTYSFRRGDKEPEKSQGFTIRAATIAAACASGDIKLAVSSKRYISGLWENTKKEPYTKIFNASTTGMRLWKFVQVMNTVDETLIECGRNLTGREKLISVHANRFILFHVFQTISPEIIETPSNGRNKLQIESITKSTLVSVTKKIAEKFAEAYPGNVFKNQERQAELLEALRQDLEAPQSV